jgi:hypothetical protein
MELSDELAQSLPIAGYATGAYGNKDRSTPLGYSGEEFVSDIERCASGRAAMYHQVSCIFV